MAIGINDLDDDDVLEQNKTEEINQPTYQNYYNNDSNEQDDFVSDFLKSRGIDDPTKIKFEGDDNQIVERNWKDLSKEEKINILNTPLDFQEDITDQLTDEEITLLNQIRQSNMTPQQYLQEIAGGEIVQEPQYSIDELSDDEVYLLDLESRVGELTDEQAVQALNIAKQQDEELYKKQVEGIRKEYKEREDFKSQQEQAELEQQQQAVFNDYQNKIVDAIDNFTSIGNLDLNFDDSDKETLAEFMLSTDETGKNYLYQALQDPETLTRAAWFILNGEEALDGITDYFTKQIKLISENQYKKGLEDGKKGVNSRPTVVINKPTTSRRQYNSIEDLDDEE